MHDHLSLIYSVFQETIAITVFVLIEVANKKEVSQSETNATLHHLTEIMGRTLFYS